MRLVLRCQSIIESPPGTFVAAFGPAAGVAGHRLTLQFAKGEALPKVGSTYNADLVGDGLEEAATDAKGATENTDINPPGATAAAGAHAVTGAAIGTGPLEPGAAAD